MSTIEVRYLKNDKFQDTFGGVSIAARSVTWTKRTRATGNYFEVERHWSLGNIHRFKVVIIIIDLIALLSMYLMESLHPSQTAGWITLCQGREFRPIPQVQGAFPRNLRSIWHVCNSTAFCPTLKLFLVTHVFSRYFRKVLVTIPSAKVTKRHTNALISHVVLISRAKFSFFANFLCLSLGKRYQLQMLCYFIDENCIKSVEMHSFISYDRHFRA